MSNDKFKELMKLSKVEIPFDDFEENIMSKIALAEKNQAALRKTHRNALIFFVLGTLFGMASNYIFAQYLNGLIVLAPNQEIIQLISLIIYVPLIVLFSLKLLELLKYHKSR